jgi:hypothetical protein
MVKLSENTIDQNASFSATEDPRTKVVWLWSSKVEGCQYSLTSV